MKIHSFAMCLLVLAHGTHVHSSTLVKLKGGYWAKKGNLGAWVEHVYIRPLEEVNSYHSSGNVIRTVRSVAVRFKREYDYQYALGFTTKSVSLKLVGADGFALSEEKDIPCDYSNNCEGTIYLSIGHPQEIAQVVLRMGVGWKHLELLPRNAKWVSKYEDDWVCSSGYVRVADSASGVDTCLSVAPPPKKKLAIPHSALPSNAGWVRFTDSIAEWACLSGYKRNANQCVKDTPHSPEKWATLQGIASNPIPSPEKPTKAPPLVVITAWVIAAGIVVLIATGP